ncbi:MAG TPA: hypothetical protein VFE61_04725 [Candidatus Sulfotelmatobacter sp.]|nr:hypothetical protein [Candidatus Sulfotelmatobacter sp.]
MAGPSVLAGIVVAALMTGFEVAKQTLVPHISIWQSHASTIGFTIVVSTVASYFLMRRLASLNGEREAAQSAIKGILPTCAYCKRIRDKKGNWLQFELYIRDRSEAEFSHCICPDCAQAQFGKK